MSLPNRKLEYSDIDKVLEDFVDTNVVKPESCLQGDAYELRTKIIDMLEHNYLKGRRYAE